MKITGFSIILFFSTTILEANELSWNNSYYDDMSGEYRTGEIDPLIMKVSHQIKRGIAKNPEKYLPELVSFLSRGAKNNYEKAKRIHDWITDNIAYNTEKLWGREAGVSRPYDILREGKTTCMSAGVKSESGENLDKALSIYSRAGDNTYTFYFTSCGNQKQINKIYQIDEKDAYSTVCEFAFNGRNFEPGFVSPPDEICVLNAFYESGLVLLTQQGSVKQNDKTYMLRIKSPDGIN